MTRHTVPSPSSRSLFSENAPARAPLDAPRRKLVGGVAAQDALVALFDDRAEEKPLEARLPDRPRGSADQARARAQTIENPALT